MYYVVLDFLIKILEGLSTSYSNNKVSNQDPKATYWQHLGGQWHRPGSKALAYGRASTRSIHFTVKFDPNLKNLKC